MDYPCGGKGSCHKCKISVRPLGSEEPWVKELACKYMVTEAVEVQVFKKVKTLDKKSNLHKTKEVHKVGEANVVKTVFSLKTYEDSGKSIQEQLVRVLEDHNLCVTIDMDTLQALSLVNLEASNGEITIVTSGDKIIAVENGNTENMLYGIAFDIGTTSVVGSLIDLKTGASMAVISKENQQKEFGSDVVSRISYTLDNEAGLSLLQEKIIQTLNEIIEALAIESGIKKASIYECSLVGNSTMSHLLLGVFPESLAKVPYQGVFKYPPLIRAESLQVNIHPKGLLRVAPCIAGQS